MKIYLINLQLKRSFGKGSGVKDPGIPQMFIFQKPIKRDILRLPLIMSQKIHYLT